MNCISLKEEFDICAIERPPIPSPERTVNTIEVEGRHGSLTELGAYKDILIQIRLNLLEDTSIKKKIRRLKGFLLDVKTLKFDDDLEVFYKVKNIIIGDVEGEIKEYGEFEIRLYCEPFLYLDSYSTPVTNNSKIYNEGTFESEPIINLKGTGDITLSINSKNIILKSITDITIDSQMKNTYNSNQPLNNKMTGDFPIFKTGENTISWTGNVTKAEIIGNWRYI